MGKNAAFEKRIELVFDNGGKTHRAAAWIWARNVSRCSCTRRFRDRLLRPPPLAVDLACSRGAQCWFAPVPSRRNRATHRSAAPQPQPGRWIRAQVQAKAVNREEVEEWMSCSSEPRSGLTSAFPARG